MILVQLHPMQWRKIKNILQAKAPEGFEPSISCLLDRRFNQLSHGATCDMCTEKQNTAKATVHSSLKKVTPNVGLEPTTLRLRVSCSTDWASRADVLWWSNLNYQLNLESRRWCSGIMQDSHSCDPGSIPGRCNVSFGCSRLCDRLHAWVRILSGTKCTMQLSPASWSDSMYVW